VNVKAVVDTLLESDWGNLLSESKTACVVGLDQILMGLGARSEIRVSFPEKVMKDFDL
jgi:hypothetical protein